MRCTYPGRGRSSRSAPLPPGPQRRSRRRARWLAPARPRWLLCGRGARAGPLASGGAIGCRPSCASLDTLAAPRGTGRCANTGSSFRALKGTRTPVAPYGNAGSPRAPRRYEAPCLSPTLPAPWERGCGAAPPRPPPGKSRSWQRGGGSGVKAAPPAPEPPRRDTPPRCINLSAVAKVQARRSPIGPPPRDVRPRHRPLAREPRRHRPLPPTSSSGAACP